MRALGVVVSTSDSVLFQMLQSADHPKFRAISQLVKAPSKL